LPEKKKNRNLGHLAHEPKKEILDRADPMSENRACGRQGEPAVFRSRSEKKEGENSSSFQLQKKAKEFRGLPRSAEKREIAVDAKKKKEDGERGSRAKKIRESHHDIGKEVGTKGIPRKEKRRKSTRKGFVPEHRGEKRKRKIGPQRGTLKKVVSPIWERKRESDV